MHGPTPSERLRRSLWNAIEEDSWAQADLDSSVSEYVREARERDQSLAEICRSRSSARCGISRWRTSRSLSPSSPNDTAAGGPT